MQGRTGLVSSTRKYLRSVIICRKAEIVALRRASEDEDWWEGRGRTECGSGKCRHQDR